MFDTMGTLYGACARGDLLTKEGDIPNMNKAMLADAIATTTGAICGTSTVTTFVESSAGVAEGGRTGLSAIITGLLFLACMFIAPIAAIIPAAATSAALIYVGILMLSNLNKIDFTDAASIVPAALMLIAMPISSSIGNAIGLALIAFTIIKIICGKAKSVPILTYVLSVIFIIKFFIAI